MDRTADEVIVVGGRRVDGALAAARRQPAGSARHRVKVLLVARDVVPGGVVISHGGEEPLDAARLLGEPVRVQRIAEDEPAVEGADQAGPVGARVAVHVVADGDDEVRVPAGHQRRDPAIWRIRSRRLAVVADHGETHGLRKTGFGAEEKKQGKNETEGPGTGGTAHGYSWRVKKRCWRTQTAGSKVGHRQPRRRAQAQGANALRRKA